MEKMLKKIEQLDPEERSKLRKMLKEKGHSSTGDEGGETDKMGWMYKEDKPDNEEYLLGRKVDRHVDAAQVSRQDDLKDFPGALFTVDDDVVARRADIDMQAKMKEDPLYAIKQREEDAKRKLLQNPIKMKQLEQLVKEREAQMKNSKKKKKKEKKSKKSKKHKDSDSDSSDSDDELINKYLAILKQKEGAGVGGAPERGMGRGGRDSEGPSRGGRGRDRHEGMSRGRRRESSSDVESSRRDRARAQHRDTRDRRQDRGRKDWRQQAGSDSSGERRPARRDRRDSSSSSGSRERGQARRHYGLLVKGKSSRDRSPAANKSRRSRSRSFERSSKRRSRSPIGRKQKREPSPVRRKHEPKKRLTAEEMERQRALMQENARARDAERESNVQRYKSEDKREKEALSKQKPGDEQFVKPLMMKHADSSSVEDRIKRNIYNIQRTNAALDKNFTKH